MIMLLPEFKLDTETSTAVTDPLKGSLDKKSYCKVQNMFVDMQHIQHFWHKS